LPVSLSSAKIIPDGTNGALARELGPLISDGASNFNDSFNKEFYTNTTSRTRHVKHIRLQADHNNIKMERLNGEVRDREKTMRGLKKVDTPIVSGY
jgi:putative transposase